MWRRALERVRIKSTSPPSIKRLAGSMRATHGGRTAGTTAEGQQSETSMLDSSHRIYVLGSSGNIGKLFSKALATKPQPPPITLLLHRANLLDPWEEAGKTVEIVTDGVSDREGAYDVEVVSGATSEDAGLASPAIQNLIVATKTLHTVDALSSVKHRLGPSSTILFAQNGMGTVEEVDEKVFPQASTRPRYLSCVVSHGLYTQGPFSSVHAGQGTIAIGDVHSGQQKQTFITQQVVQASLLGPREVSSSDLKLLQLEKLVMNAMMNPLTVIFDCRNGELFSRPPISRLMDLLLAEVSQVIRSLPELQEDPSIQDRFSVEKLRGVVLHIAEITAQNTSSMLQDVRAKRPTEIDYINGYIIRRGKELGIDCNNNERLSDMVRKAHVITEAEIGQYFPKFV